MGSHNRLNDPKRNVWREPDGVASYLRSRLNAARKESDALHPTLWRDWRAIARDKAQCRYAPRQHNTGAAFGGALRWHENAGAALRWVFADKADGVGRRIDHKGWFDSDLQEETYRGVVFRIPRGRFMAGVMHGAESRTRGWKAASGDPDAAIIDHSATYDSERDAAYAADGIAKCLAEKERDYQEAWQAGARVAELESDVSEIRQGILETLEEFRAARKALETSAFANLCDAIRDNVRARLREYAKARRKIGELVERYAESTYHNQGAAFADGRGAR